MEIYLLTALQIIVAFQLVLLIPPIVIDTLKLSGNGRNNPFFIRMNENLHSNDYGPIFWQEWFECCSKKLITNFLLSNVSIKFRQDMELLGQAIEIEYKVMTQKGVNKKEYRKAQAKQLTRYDQFVGITENELNLSLAYISSFAVKFCEDVALKDYHYIIRYIKTMVFVVWWSFKR